MTSRPPHSAQLCRDSKVQHPRIGTITQPDARVLNSAHVAQGSLRSRRNPLELVGSTIDLISASPVALAHCVEAHGAPAVRVEECALADRRSKGTQRLWFAVQESSRRCLSLFEERAEFTRGAACKVHGMSLSGLSLRRGPTRPPCVLHVASRRTYGYRRIHAELTMAMSVQVSSRLVSVLMTQAGIYGLPGARSSETSAAS